MRNWRMVLISAVIGVFLLVISLNEIGKLEDTISTVEAKCVSCTKDTIVFEYTDSGEVKSLSIHGKASKYNVGEIYTFSLNANGEVVQAAYLTYIKYFIFAAILTTVIVVPAGLASSLKNYKERY